MVKALLLFERRFTLTCVGGRVVEVFMDLYQLPEGYSQAYPEGYRFSWIAFDSENPQARVLFDCHHPKGPHVHVDEDSDGESFEWTSLDEVYELFFEKLRERFGDYQMDEEG
jgi:hypothetical protein